MPTPIRGLVVEDSAEDVDLLVRELEGIGYAVEHERVHTAAAMRAALSHSAWDLVLSDYEMPGFSAPAALAVLHASGLDLPFIIVSSTVGEETAVAALKAGAHDFFVKGPLAGLGPAIERELAEMRARRERTRAAEALRGSEARYRSLVEHAVFGLYQATLDGRFLIVNPALVTMLGYESTDDLIEVGLPNLYADAQVCRDQLRRAGERRRLAGDEAMWTRKDGALIRVRLSGRVTEDRGTAQPILEVIVEDVTDQQQLQDQLRQAQKMEAVGQLAGGVAHDFNNMLTAILGYAELLTEQIGPDKPVGRDLRQIKTAAERAAALTKQLLAFSRKQVLTVKAVDLSEVVRTVEPMLRRLLGAPIEIQTRLADDLIPVMADAAQLEHLLINLSINARDAMPHGGVLTFTTGNIELDAAYVRAHRGAKAGSYALVSVTDTGVGMSPEVQARIFEPFFTTKERGRGTGLGLAAVYGTVKQLSGYIAVESEPGRGSTFTIHLPTTQEAVEGPRAPVRTAVPVGSETILLVEDENGVRAFIKVALRRFGYQVIEADSAEAALAALEHATTPVDLLLTDIVLPGMDGWQLAACVWRDRPAMRVLFMSGYTAEPGNRNGYLRPGVQLLEKPFTAQTLLTRTRQVLGANAS